MDAPLLHAQHQDPAWHEYLTARALLVGTLLGGVFSFIVQKLMFTVGVIPSLNIAAGLLGYFVIQAWVKVANKLGIPGVKPFTPQENTVIQTCTVACYGLSYSGGFGTYLLGMDRQTWSNLGTMPGNDPAQVVEPDIYRTLPFLLLVALIGIFMIVQLRKMFIIDYNLSYPSGTATGLIIDSLHSLDGAQQAQRQINALLKWAAVSFCWSAYKWFFSSPDPHCSGFDEFPTFGLLLAKWTWYFSFNLTYVGCGFIVPYTIVYSMFVGALLSWGLLWPLLSTKAGDWYPADLPANSFEGLYGYKVFISIAIILGDGAFNIVKLLAVAYAGFQDQKRRDAEAAGNLSTQHNPKLHLEEQDEHNTGTDLNETSRRRVFLQLPCVAPLPAQ